MMAASMGGSESIEQIIAFSHNVGAAEVGLATGGTWMYRTIRKFGFGDSTHVELPGENPGIVLSPAEWSGSSLATIAFGHSISTTPLAMVRAYAAIANGGLLLRPRIMSAIEDSDGTPIYRYGRETERRVMSQKTAATLRTFLRAVVLHGTGNPTARVPGYTTAGKTGTAQMVVDGAYLPGAYVASFIGMIPAEHPRYVILVKVERPHGSIYGSQVAAPVFADLARAAMLHAGDMPAFAPHPSRTGACNRIPALGPGPGDARKDSADARHRPPRSDLTGRSRCRLAPAVGRRDRHGLARGQPGRCSSPCAGNAWTATPTSTTRSPAARRSSS